MTVLTPRNTPMGRMAPRPEAARFSGTKARVVTDVLAGQPLADELVDQRNLQRGHLPPARRQLEREVQQPVTVLLRGRLRDRIAHRHLWLLLRLFPGIDVGRF